MGRILAIDYGRKRTGIAVTDPLQMIATPLNTTATHLLMAFLKSYIVNEVVEAFVVGAPKRLNNEPTDASELVKAFVKQLQKQFPDIPVHLIDERFTSKMASQAILMSGVNKKTRQDKALVDTISATIILQSYLLQKEFGNGFQ